MAKCLFFHIPTLGCYNAIEPVLVCLITRGYEVIHYNHGDFFSRYSTNDQIDRKSYPQYGGYLRDRITSEMNLYDFGSVLLETAENTIDFIEQEVLLHKPDVILHSKFMVAAKVVASKYYIPAVCLTGGFIFHPKIVLDFQKKSGVKVNFNHILSIKRYNERADKFYKSRVEGAVNKDDVFVNEEATTVVLGLKEFQPHAELFGDNVFFTGPTIQEKPFLKTHEVIYVSLGSVFANNADFFRLCIQVFSELKRPVIISLGNHLSPDDFDSIPENIKLERFANQKEILKRACLFITHGGGNSTFESIYFETPMIVIPQIIEQNYFGSKVEELGIGRFLQPDNVTYDSLKSVTKELLENNGYRDKVSEYRKTLPAAAAETACDYIFKSRNDHKRFNMNADTTPATFQQQGVWMHTQKSNQLSWNTVELKKYSGALNYNFFLKATEILINTYDSLRTNFITIEGVLHQKFSHNFSLDKYVQYHKTENDSESEATINELINTEQRYLFDLSKGPLIRIIVVHANPNSWYFVINRHHIISDVTSRNIFWSELSKIYNSLVKHEEPRPPLCISYQLYSKWQLSSVSSEAYEKKKKAYGGRIGKRLESFISPFASNNRDANSTEMDEMSIPTDLLQEIRNYSLRTRSVFSSVFLSAYYLLLFKYSSDKDMTIGFVQNGRKVSGLPGLDKSLGLFATIAPINAPVVDTMTLSEFQRMVDLLVKESLSEPLVFYEDLRREFASETDAGAILPIFNMMKVTRQKDRFINMFEETIENPFGANNVISNHDFSIFVIDSIENVKVRIFTRVSRAFKGHTKVILEHYLQILRAIIADNAKHVSNFFPDANAAIVKGRAVNEHDSEPLTFALAKIAARYHSNIAIMHNSNIYSYETLNRRSNQLANALIKMGVGREKTVAIYMKPSFEMVQSIVAIWRAGGAYVPIRRDLPVDRIKTILNDARVNCILTDQRMEADLLHYKMFNVGETDISSESTEEPDLNIDPDDLAYIIYTSGTTGTPKGVMIENKGIANTINWRVREYKMDGNHRALQLFDYSFDGFLTSVFTPLLSGSTLHLIDEDLQSNTGFIADYIQDQAITHFIVVPALLDSILSQSTERSTSLGSLQMVTLAGDAVSKTLLQKIHDVHIPTEIVNEYGPTEGSVAATIRRNLNEREEITIGHPIDGTSVYILDATCNVQPVGIMGQVALGGSGLARGYLNQHELTSQKFIHLPGYERIYLTGDVGRILPNGEVEVSGRIDDQVKIRGFRIELGEIENEIRKYPGVNDAVVFAQTIASNESILCCLFVSEKAEESGFKNFLKEKLPYYMIPAFFQRVDKIPLTQTGKVDRKKLQNYSVGQVKEKLFTAPKSTLEKKLAALYARSLEIKENEISIDDDFFYLKGHSIKAIQLLAWIEKEFNVRISLREFFEGSSIEDLRNKIINAGKLNFDPIPPAGTRTWYPATPQQKRLYVTQEKCLTEIAYNIPVFYHIKGNLNVPEFERAITSVGHLYDVFKTYFTYRNNELVQCIDADASLGIEYHEINSDTLTQCLEKADRPFDLSKAPLAAVKLYKTGEANFYLLFSIHHILLDGMSMPRVIDAIANQYNRLPVIVPRVTYKDYAAWFTQKLENNAFAMQRSYWQKKLRPPIPVLNISTDYPRPAIQDYIGAAHTFLVDEEMTRRLDQLSVKCKVTLFSLLLSVYYIVMHKYSRQEDIIVGTLNYGRNHADITDTVGLFIKTLPLRNFPVSSKNVISFIQEVNHSVMEAFDNQDYPFESMLDDLKMPREISRTPLFDTFFLFDSENYRELSLSTDLEILPFRVKREKSKFDIEIDTVKANGKIRFWISYRSSLYKESSIAVLSSDILSVLYQVVDGNSQTIQDICLQTCSMGRLVHQESASERVREFKIQQTPLRNSLSYDSHAEEGIQLQILLIFAEILESEPDEINPMDSFFELGGHSMTAVRLLQKLKENFGVKITLEDFMHNPSLDFINKSIKRFPVQVN